MEQKNKSILWLLTLLLFFDVPASSSGNDFSDNGRFSEILPGIYLYNDICNVYLLKSGSSVLLIDAGSGQIANDLKEIGVKQVEWILHTHYHRDQTAGSVEFKKEGAQVAIGEAEAPLLNRSEKKAPFKVPDSFLLNGELEGWGKRLAPFESPGADRGLNDNEVFEWNEYRITAINTPGHTEGSVSFIIEADEKKICFTGDLIMNGGHVRDLCSMQWEYLKNPGVEASMTSLEKLENLNPDLLLPSHGDIIENPAQDVDLLKTRLKKVWDAFNYKRAGRWNWSQFVQVSDHVIQDGGSTTQIVVSDSGEALLFDCGEEFSPERLKKAKAKFGIKKIDVIIPSHWHYDHVDGINTMVEAEGAEVWVWEGLAEYIQHPQRFPVTCWSGEPVKIDRVLKEGEEFDWGGYNFKVYHHPVHTEQQMGLYAKVDGLDFYLIADGLSYTKNGRLRGPIHCYNGITLSGGLIKTAQSFFEASPYICLPAHSNVFAVAPEDKQEFKNWTVEITDAIRALLTPPLPDLGYDPYWASFYPARIQVTPGEEITINLRLKNYTKEKMNGSYRLKSYGNPEISGEPTEYQLNPGETRDFPITVKNKKSANKGIHIVTADIKYGNESFAEYPQAYIEINE